MSTAAGVTIFTSRKGEMMDTVKPAGGADATSAVGDEPTRFNRTLGVPGIVATVLAFNAPIAVAGGFVPIMIAYGSQEGTPATFVAIGVLLTIFAVGIVAMARYMKSPGAFYSYITAGLGRIAGLGGGFMAIAAYASFGVTSACYLGIVTDGMVAGTLGGPHLSWWIWSLILLGAAVTLSLFNIELSARVLTVCLVAEVILVLLWSLRVFFTGGTAGVSVHVFSPSAFVSGSIGIALLLGVMNVTGFEAAAVFRSEAVDPVRTVPRATYVAVISMCVLYCLSSWAYITAYGDDAVNQGSTDPSGSFVASVATYVGTVAADIVSVLMVTSTFACVLALQNIGARYFFTLGTDRVLPAAFGRIHKKQKAPYVAAAAFSLFAFGGIIISAVAGIDPLRTYSVMSAIAGLCLIVLYTLTSVAVVAFFRRTHHDATIWQSTIAPIISLIGLAVILYLGVTNMAFIMGGSQSAADIAIGVVAAFLLAGIGLASYYRWRKPDVYARIGRQDD